MPRCRINIGPLLRDEGRARGRWLAASVLGVFLLQSTGSCRCCCWGFLPAPGVGELSCWNVTGGWEVQGWGLTATESPVNVGYARNSLSLCVLSFLSSLALPTYHLKPDQQKWRLPFVKLVSLYRSSSPCLTRSLPTFTTNRANINSPS